MNVFCPSCNGRFVVDGTRVGATIFCAFCGSSFGLANGETRAVERSASGRAASPGGGGPDGPSVGDVVAAELRRASTVAKGDAELGDALNPSLASPTAVGEIGDDDGPDQPAAGTIIDSYELERPIGKGGMGVVWRAAQVSLGRPVAVKILPRQLAALPEFVARFEREARALAALNHPNIVGIHDRGVFRSRPYIVMEFVDGVSLRRLMRSGELSHRMACDLVPQVLDALDFAHDEGVIHRDIKPENIMVDKRGRAKVADFGLARIIVGDDGGRSRLTRTNVLMGTPDYMAPEQRESSGTVDQRADLYSFGVVLYEMLTGELPLGRFDPPSHRNHRVDARIDEIVLRVLSKDPDRRHDRASELRSELQIALSDSELARREGSGEETFVPAEWGPRREDEGPTQALPGRADVDAEPSPVGEADDRFVERFSSLLKERLGRVKGIKPRAIGGFHVGVNAGDDPWAIRLLEDGTPDAVEATLQDARAAIEKQSLFEESIVTVLCARTFEDIGSALWRVKTFCADVPWWGEERKVILVDLERGTVNGDPAQRHTSGLFRTKRRRILAACVDVGEELLARRRGRAPIEAPERRGGGALRAVLMVAVLLIVGVCAGGLALFPAFSLSDKEARPGYRFDPSTPAVDPTGGMRWAVVLDRIERTLEQRGLAIASTRLTADGVLTVSVRQGETWSGPWPDGLDLVLSAVVMNLAVELDELEGRSWEYSSGERKLVWRPDDGR